MIDSPFILVCHPHAKPGFAIPFDSEQALIDLWVMCDFDVRCNCCASESSVATYDAAIEDIGHDMHDLTRLDSRAEYDEYMEAACHNKATDSVYRAALFLEWVDIEDEEDDPYFVDSTLSGWAVVRTDGQYAEFADSPEAEEAAERLNSGLAKESEYYWSEKS